ncbi:MAG: AAA family ATPase [Candidatus Latescibacteria bacterium]|nr:AAA family ATPase [Candidatus Latescibacterota bacterium]NIM22036.1 AAA family ATPase [Candidatus Latescibacterota bacterium]NIM66054.1 AAA family ATPase [Candidatus Latescibacterota bacterium]NIO02462.1 AAA family ATPase [Candidatus Latescibacterota bacterium]NIO29373.1 AAA family ATPase [Candidatus Latescibacterota bacterium]
MRISGFQVSRYGPLSEFSIRDAPAFTLFHGPNEQGKTLLIDALIKLLFRKGLKRHLKHFGNIRRVSEEPEGCVVIEADGREHKLEGNETIASHYPVPITPVDFRNVFIIRDSDLSLSEEKEYYTDVTEKLTGMRTTEIQRLMEEIRKKGRLTSSKSDARLSDSVDFEKIAGKVDQAERLVSDVAELRVRLAGDRFDELEKDLAETRVRLASAEKSLELQERARKREKLEKAKQDMEELSETLADLSGLERVNEKDLRAWQEATWIGEKAKEALEKSSANLEEAKEKIVECTRTIESLRSEKDALDATRQAAEIKLKPKMDAYRSDRESITSAGTKETAFRRARNVSLIFLLVALIGNIFAPSVFFWIVGGVALAGILVFGYRILRLYNMRARAAEALEAVLLDASELGFEGGETLSDLLRITGELDKKLASTQRKLDRIEGDKNSVMRDRERVESEMRDHHEALKNAEDTVRSLQMTTGVDTLEDLHSAIEGKREKEKKRASLEAVLTSSLGPTESGEKGVAAWRRSVDKSMVEEDSSEGLSYDQGTVDALEKEREVLEQRIRDLGERLKTADDDILRIQSKVNMANLPVETPEGLRATAALENLEGKLREFCSAVNLVADNAREALRIFEAVADEEKNRVTGLFGKEAAVSKYFAETTENRYTEVHFDPEASEIYAVQPDGTRLNAGYLSGGAYDQLYLAIRLSIGEQFLQGGKGFFIMDDPFVKSDFARLKRQLDTLIRLARAGWQILYFSAKKEVLEALEEPIESGAVHLVRLEDLVTADRE